MAFSIEDSLTLESAELTLIDGDGDGLPNAVQGSGTCSYSYFIPDVEQRVSCTFTLQGNPDLTPPELAITSDAALRVPLTGGETHVRFQYRMLAESTEYRDCSSLSVRAGFPGLPPYQNAATYRLSRPEVFDQPTNHEVWGAAGPIVEQEITVLAGTTGEVILRFFDDPSFGSYGPQCPPTALLIDELRAE